MNPHSKRSIKDECTQKYYTVYVIVTSILLKQTHVNSIIWYKNNLIFICIKIS